MIKKTRKTPAAPVLSLSMSTELVVESKQSDDALLADLLSTVGVVEAAAEAEPESTEVIEPAGDLIDIDAAIDAASQALENQEHYEKQAEAAAVEPQPAGDVPTVAVKGKRKAKTAEPKAPKVAKVKTPKEPKPPAPPRVTFHGNSKSVVLNNRVGGKIADFLVLEASDAMLSAEDLAAKQAALKDELDTKIAKKVAEKAIMLFKDLAAGRKIGNEVMVRAFATLARDGFLTSGDKGNMQAALNDKYSIGTSRSQANQMFALFPFLKITMKDGKGRQVANQDSNVLATVAKLHDLTVATAAA